MRAEIAKLDAASGPNEQLIRATHDFLTGSDPTADTARLERRLGNLEALHASNQLARAQAVLAIDNLAGLLDRYQEIENLLFPVWQQHALAVAQGAVSPDEFSSEITALDQVQTRFDHALRESKEHSE
jgi:hypothetical protein